jgi:hypothetical protein
VLSPVSYADIVCCHKAFTQLTVSALTPSESSWLLRGMAVG